MQIVAGCHLRTTTVAERGTFGIPREPTSPVPQPVQETRNSLVVAAEFWETRTSAMPMRNLSLDEETI